MARTLLITWPSNEEAERFCRILDQVQTGTYEGLTDEGLAELADLLTDSDDLPQMDALIARPTLACKCSQTRKGNMIGYTRMPKFGWFVHAKCKRPAPPVVRNFIANRIMGNNDLLPEVIGRGIAIQSSVDAEIIDIHQRKETIGA
jgi:hypothetical protein